MYVLPVVDYERIFIVYRGLRKIRLCFPGRKIKDEKVFTDLQLFPCAWLWFNTYRVYQYHTGSLHWHRDKVADASLMNEATLEDVTSSNYYLLINLKIHPKTNHIPVNILLVMMYD